MAGPSPGDSKRPTPTLFVWGRRYRRVGACLGLILGWNMGGTIPDWLMRVVLTPIIGAGLGTIFGMLGGALKDRMEHRRRIGESKPCSPGEL